MDNSIATRPYSRLKGDPYRAFEALPPEVRRALQEALVDWCSLRAREWHLHLLRQERLRPAQAASVLVQTIRRLDHAEVAAFARGWPSGAEAYPHLAAGATLQRYAGAAGIPIPSVPPAAHPKAARPKAKPPKAKPPKAPPPTSATRIAAPPSPRGKAAPKRDKHRRGRR